MGIGSLRRYHKPRTETTAPEVEPGTTETTEEAAAAAAANEAKLAAEQAAQAEAANSHPDGTAANEEGTADNGAADSVHPIIQEAGGEEEHKPGEPAPTIPTHEPGVESENGAQHDEIENGTPVTPGTPEGEQEQAEAAAEAAAEVEPESTKHGELERPNRGSSKALWLAYTEADPGGVPEGVEELSRDELAELYLGPR